MSYTILSARYANADHDAAVITTQEAADVVISADDTPGEWAAMLEWGEPAAYVAPPEPAEPDPVEKLRAFLAANPDVAKLLNG